MGSHREEEAATTYSHINTERSLQDYTVRNHEQLEEASNYVRAISLDSLNLKKRDSSQYELKKRSPLIFLFPFGHST
jgi:hypothetical protein